MFVTHPVLPLLYFFFFNDTAPTEIYTLSLHDALPICADSYPSLLARLICVITHGPACRSEEHTSELQSQFHLVCRLLLEKKKDLCNPCRIVVIKKNMILKVISVLR